MAAMTEDVSLPRTQAVLDEGLAQGRELGAQLAVSLGGEPIADITVGADGSGGPMRPDTMLPWFSMTKATTSVATMQQWERGRLRLDDRVVDHVPEFGRGGPGKEAVTIRHLLTHTGGFRMGDSGRGGVGDSPLGRTLAQNLELIYDAPLEEGWVPGRKAGYHPTSGMALLADIVQRTSGRPFEEYVRDEVFLPLDMPDCWIGMPPEVIDKAIANDQIGTMHRKAADGSFVPLAGLSTPLGLSLVVPGGGGRGPMVQLVHLYEALAAGGVRRGHRILGEQTVEAMLGRHRVGMFDETFRITIDWTLGLHIDTAHMGRHCSPRAAGHGGAQSSVAFCDPEHGLAVAVVFNGMIQTDHAPRLESLFTALYVDLGLAAADDPGRDHPYPGVAA